MDLFLCSWLTIGVKVALGKLNVSFLLSFSFHIAAIVGSPYNNAKLYYDLASK